MKCRSMMLFGGVLLLGGLLAGLLLKFFTHSTQAGNENLRCAVCGMDVNQHGAWLAKMRFDDGSVVWFDGAKDLFRYYFDIHRYDSKRALQEIQTLQVTDYYTLNLIDGYKSRFVIGSDVLGPMGHELIPFATEIAAREFIRDHRGKSVVTFQEVTKEVISHLE